MSHSDRFPKYTYQDYKNWKEDWELIDGYPLQLLPSPSAKHSKTLSRLIYQGMKSFDAQKKCNCMVFSELDWKLSDTTVVRPDVMIICGNTDQECLEFPPVLIIEILSPHNMKTDRVIKFDLYRENGVKFYLMVDPIKETIEVYELIDNYYKQVEKNEFLIDKNCKVVFDYDEIWK